MLCANYPPQEPVTRPRRHGKSVYDRLNDQANRQHEKRMANRSHNVDALDFALNANFDPVADLFPAKVDVYLQPQTIGLTSRIYVKPDAKDATKSHSLLHSLSLKQPHKPWQYPINIGGILEKEDPNHVKLMNSGPHSPQTNAGYIRNGQGGNTYNY